MKYIVVALFALHAGLAQTGKTGTASIAGTVLDAETLKPIPGALVTASRAGAPPMVKQTKSGGDGAFRIPGLISGDYLICAQTTGERYLNPCEWAGAAAGVTVTSAMEARGIAIALSPAVVLNVQVRDPQKDLAKLTKEGRRPELSIGVWGPNGHYHPAILVSEPAGAADAQASVSTYGYRLAVPCETALKFHISSRQLMLGDENGVALPANASQQAFQQAKGEPKQKSFTYTVLGKLP